MANTHLHHHHYQQLYLLSYLWSSIGAYFFELPNVTVTLGNIILICNTNLACSAGIFLMREWAFSY